MAPAHDDIVTIAVIMVVAYFVLSIMIMPR